TAGEEPAVGPSLAFETGVGGAWRNSRPRFFLAARYERSAVEFTGADVSRRSYDDLSLGLRLLIPIAEPVRIYFDLLLGGTRAEARLERDGLPMLESERWRPLGQLALGLQVRPLTHFSFGARLQWSWSDDAPDALAMAAGRELGAFRIGAAAV